MNFFEKFFPSGNNSNVTANSDSQDLFLDEDLSQDADFYKDIENWGGIKIAKHSRS